MKIRELIMMQSTLVKILTKEMPFKLSYRLMRLSDKVKSELTRIEKIRNDMFKKYGEPDKNGMKIKDEFVETYQKEWNEFAEENIQFDFDPIPQECLEAISLSPVEVSSIQAVIEKK
jgi:Ser-tRNA(Ala) deacylase AlaX